MCKLGTILEITNGCDKIICSLGDCKVYKVSWRNQTTKCTVGNCANAADILDNKKKKILVMKNKKNKIFHIFKA